MQSPKYYIEGFRPADTKIHITENRLTTDNKILKEKYTIAATFASAEQLAHVLETVVHENTLVYIVYSNHAAINNPGHFAGLFKHSNKYYLYDVRNTYGETEYVSVYEVANDILALSNKIGLIICGFNNDNNDYPLQKNILDMIYSSLPVVQHKLAASAITAIMIRCQKSLRYFLDLGLSPTYKTKDNMSLLEMAVISNSADIVAMLLKEPGVDPNYCIYKQKPPTCLHIAAAKGYFEVVKILLEDARIVAKQKDYYGKTAFDYAYNKHKKTQHILELYSKNDSVE